MNHKSIPIIVLIVLMVPAICCIAFADSAKEITWVEITNVKFDGQIDFQQETMGTMDDLIAKYKRGERGVRIFATGKIVDNSGKSLEIFDQVPAKIITLKGSDYYQFDKGDWRFRSSTNPNEKYMKVFKREN